ncbi:MAG: PLP-dependent transferase [Candidatus Gastranaerophilales bacterium]|nr:PLP-dependent transferase [Candidatus Gastranaerophilales bacterium]
MEFQTKTIHAGQHADPQTGAVSVPIYQTSTFAQGDIGKYPEYMYTRMGNPTRDALEKCLAALENAKYCLTFSSGVNAEAAALSLLNPGDHVVAVEDIYGGTYKLFEGVYNRQNITVTYVNGDNPENFAAAIKENTRLVWLESPTNPLLKIVDIEAIAEICRNKGVLVCVDNTFATPYFQNPLNLGADIVVHSMTKFINGHSDVIGGAVMTNSDELYEEFKHYQVIVGGTPSPFDSWLVLRGVKTLAVRMERHENNAKQVAKFLFEHPMVEKVFYPGLPTDPQYRLARKQMTGFGGVVSFRINGGKEETSLFFRNLKLIPLAVSLGGAESIASYPYGMSHAAVPKEEKERLGITDNLVRLSVGIEHINDLLEDIGQALNAVREGSKCTK